MQKIIIVGNSIAADIVYGFLEQDRRYEVVCFAVDKEYITEERKFGLKVENLGYISEKYLTDNHRIMLGVGYDNVDLDKLNKSKQNINLTNNTLEKSPAPHEPDVAAIAWARNPRLHFCAPSPHSRRPVREKGTRRGRLRGAAPNHPRHSDWRPLQE